MHYSKLMLLLATAFFLSVGGSVAADTITVSLTNPSFSPNQDGVKDSTTFNASLDFQEPVSWTLSIKDSAGATLQSISGTSYTVSFTWDGRDAGGVLMGDGNYTFDLDVAVGNTIHEREIATTIDTVPPVVRVASPADGEILSNFYHGSSDFPVKGTVTDGSLASWELRARHGSSNDLLVATGTNEVIDGATVAIWRTQQPRYTGSFSPNGAWILTLRAVDAAGNPPASVSTNVVLSNFEATLQSPAERADPELGTFELDANDPASNHPTYYSILPSLPDVPLFTETLLIRNADGVVVRTLVEGAERAAGEYEDPWLGESDDGTTLRDGPYSYSVILSDATRSLTWDRSATMRWPTEFSDLSPDAYMTASTPFDPFNNRPMIITYGGRQRTATRFSIQAAPKFGAWPDCTDLAAGDHCITDAVYTPKGIQTFVWAGTLPDGTFLPDRHSLSAFPTLHTFPENVIVRFGTALKMTSLRTDPPLYNPAAGEPQALSFDLSTFVNATVSYTVRYLNQASRSTLRTLTTTAAVAGQQIVLWDGKAENGAWVAPGRYTVIVTATDSLGNDASQHAVMTVQY